MGVSLQRNGINFAVYAAEEIESLSLSLFSKDNTSLEEIPLDPQTNRTGAVWHIEIENPPLPCQYAYRINGKTSENPLLLDPYAYGVNTSHQWGLKEKYSPLGEIVDPRETFAWEGDKAPNTPLKDSLIYEMHVRGFSNDSSSQVKHPGTYLGIIEKIPHLVDLGITAVELLPIHEFNECEYDRVNPYTGEQLYNYWGYSTVNTFSPMKRYASSDHLYAAQTEFKTMVKALHKHGIEVILDVVFNHTGEGSLLGPTLSYRGFDPRAYYIIDSKGKYLDFSGCGNTFNCSHPIASELILHSLRYWVYEMHVDGFRFDLATVFLRNQKGEPKETSSLIKAITADPILANTKLIAEPWDAGGLYRVGSFAPPQSRWSEWNGSYRDDVRSFIKGDAKAKNLFATRLCGSQDIYGRGHTPCTSLNFITCHDGFTLSDLVSYNTKHNMSNGEENRDGTQDNRSWNCGAEGVTKDKKIMELRSRQMRNLHVALMISQGIPMVLMGDEYGHTKQGNNNTWCQDNALNWFLWDKLDENGAFYRFYRLMIHFRKEHPQLCKGEFLSDQDIIWHGKEGKQPHWNNDDHFIAFTLKGEHDLFIAFNASSKPVTVTFPQGKYPWHWVVNTSSPSPNDFFEGRGPKAQPNIMMTPYSAIILKNK